MNHKLLLSFLAVLISMFSIRAQQSQTLNVTYPGSLNSILRTDINSITDLTLTGTINDADFTTIKQMTSLINLDISDVNIVNETIPAKSFINRSFNKLILPKSVKSIEMNAFEQVTISDKLVLPSGITYLGKDVFHEANLKGGIVLPSSLRKTGSGIFWAAQVPSLDFSICQDLEELGFYSFAKTRIANGFVDLSTNRKLKKFGANPSTSEGLFSFYSGKVILPNNMTNLPGYSFAKFTGEVVFPNLDSIGINAFEMATISQKLILPSGITYLGKDVFHEANLKGGIVLPSSLRKTGSGIFWAAQVPSVDFSICQDLEELGFYSFAKARIANGLVDLSTNSKLKKFGDNPSTSEGAFSFYSGKVILPNNMTSLPDYSFAKFTGEVVFPNLDSIGKNAFEMATISQKLILPSGITYIAKDVFHEANLKGGIVLPSSLRKTGSGIFWAAQVPSVDFSICQDLEELGFYSFAKARIANGLVDLSTNSKLKKFGDNPSTSEGAFSFYSGKVILPNNMTSLPDYSFAKFTGEVVFPNLDSIGKNAFEMATISQKLILPSGITYIAKDVFHEANLKGGIVLPSSLRKTGSGIFWAVQVPSVDFSVCPNLEELGFYTFAKARIGSGLVDLSSNTKLKKLGTNPSTSEGLFSLYTGNAILPSHLEVIPSFTFARFDGIITLPLSLEKIESNAFLNSAITEVELPNSVNYIGDNAFLNCTQLSKIISNNTTPPALGSSVFSGVDVSNCILTVKNESLTAYSIADQWKDFIKVSPFMSELRSVDQTFSENEASVSVYPNPTIDIINIKGDNIEKVNIYSIDGQLVKTAAKTNYINVQDLSTGIYIVKIKTSNGITSQKIMKK